MLTFLKSDLFLRFLGGFAIGSAGLFAFHVAEPPALTTPAMAAPESAPQATEHAAR
ncbi:hypothetical protein TomMM35A_25670 [Sphingobium sp. TomMM35A]|jgi:hypothetical protein|uniref:hypothetical protein n=1 Tax=unclassified Sphingobium TaxID=2611147 RepID=UPI00191B1DB0|nr:MULTISPECIES: hypothetical protein [unclassified Sphingobium]CAD7337969.1 hypothetical protein SPHS6_01766 [Sphingobium sp. S6]CAD7338872.1 hypothetical protein SPHS8_02346 [Sphingobium sp. S8]